MHLDALCEILVGLDFEPVGQPARPMLRRARHQQRPFAVMLAHLDHAPDPAGRHDAVVDATQWHDGTAHEGYRFHRTLEALGQPRRVAVEEGLGLTPPAEPWHGQERGPAMWQ